MAADVVSLSPSPRWRRLCVGRVRACGKASILSAQNGAEVRLPCVCKGVCVKGRVFKTKHSVGTKWCGGAPASVNVFASISEANN